MPPLDRQIARNAIRRVDSLAGEQATRPVLPAGPPGKMSNVPHYVGCALAASIILPLAVMHKGPLVAVLAGVPAYALCLLIGVVLWRRSMVREVRVVVSRIIAARAGA
jgi:hypothetical protein